MIFPTPETNCGPGSMMEATVSVRAWLPAALVRHGVRRLLDAPCGDRNWIRTLMLPCDYIGVDHEPEHVAKAGPSAQLGDVRTDPLPEADAILSRDFFQHLSKADAALALANMRRTGARIIFATCHGKTGPADCDTGAFRFIDHRSEWGAPIDSVDDGSDGRILGVWALR